MRTPRLGVAEADAVDEGLRGHRRARRLGAPLGRGADRGGDTSGGEDVGLDLLRRAGGDGTFERRVVGRPDRAQQRLVVPGEVRVGPDPTVGGAPEARLGREAGARRGAVDPKEALADQGRADLVGSRDGGIASPVRASPNRAAASSAARTQATPTSSTGSRGGVATGYAARAP